MKITTEMLHPLKNRASDVADILNAALESVNPGQVTIQSLKDLIQVVDFAKFHRLGMVSMGKAAIPMALAVMEILGENIDSGIVVTKAIPMGGATFPPEIRLFQGNHPIPGGDSLIAGEAIIKYLVAFEEQDAVLFLISGGTSALVTYPVYAVDLLDLVETTQLLLECGASINEINTVRKHLDVCKGGQLANSTSPATCISLILSDVIGNRIDMIASGPTVPDPTTFADALDVLKKYSLLDDVPEAVLSFITDGNTGIVMETPKPGNTVFSKNRALIIACLEQAMNAAKNKATDLGYVTEFYGPLLTGEARERGVQLAEFLRKKAVTQQPGNMPRCWIAGGETTVTKKGNGYGGRNQELALAAVEELSGVHGTALISFATDGEDGRSPAAGAIVTGSTFKDAREKGINPAEYLARNDSYSFFSYLNSSIITGSTGTNVNDLVLMLLD